jgi:hypothetical protein
LVVGWCGSTGLIGVIVGHGVRRLRFAAATIDDPIRWWGCTRVVRVIVGRGV